MNKSEDFLIEHCTKIRVIYADTDKMGIVHNSKYLEYFEIGRSELVRSMGMSYKKVEESGVMLPLIEANLKFKRGANYDDVLDIRAFITEIPKVKMKINYEIFLKDFLLCEGYTIHVFVKSDNFRPVRVPDFFLKLLTTQK
jgi:acyl-CoA thioester hydrolase